MSTMPRYLTGPEVAKMVRARLKEEFPGTKFSVRSSRHAGGKAVRVSYTGGPPQYQVNDVVKCYEGARFCGMTDYGFSVEHWYNATTNRMCVAHQEETHSTHPVKTPCPGPEWELVSTGNCWVTADRTSAVDEPCAVCGQVPKPRLTTWGGKRHEHRGECADPVCKRVCQELTRYDEWRAQKPVGNVDDWELVEACRNNYALETRKETA